MTKEGEGLREKFLRALIDTAISLQPGDDPEVTLEALIEASRLLTEHLQGELQELREEQAD
jgi:hypothetical protein